MMRIASGFIAGLVFGLGLVISGMSNPAKVLNFLDILGPWDPSLAFVMAGASITTYIGYRIVWLRESPALGSKFDVPSSTVIDRPLLTGAAVFGMGWGLGGFCPGPAWASLAIASPGVMVFLPFMLLGLVLGGKAKSSLSSK